MSRYDDMPTPELLAVPPGEVALDHGNALAWAAAMRDRLAAYERIVEGLRAMSEPLSAAGDTDGWCDLCHRPVAVPTGRTDEHAPDCPWWLAQQTRSGQP